MLNHENRSSKAVSDLLFLSVFVGRHRLTGILPTFRKHFIRVFTRNGGFGVAAAGAAFHSAG